MRSLSKKRLWPSLPLQQRPIALVTNAIIGAGNGPLNNGLFQVGDQIFTTTKWFIRDRYEYPRQAGQVMDRRFPFELHKFSEESAGLQLVKVPEVRLTDCPSDEALNENGQSAEVLMANNNDSIRNTSQFLLSEYVNLPAIFNPYYNYWNNYYHQQQLMSGYVNSIAIPDKLATVMLNPPVVFNAERKHINIKNCTGLEQKDYRKDNSPLELPNQLTSILPVQNQRKVQFRLQQKSFKKVSTLSPFVEETSLKLVPLCLFKIKYLLFCFKQ